MSSSARHVHFVGRRKDVTESLMSASGLPFTLVRRPKLPLLGGRFALALELAHRVIHLMALIARIRPSVILTSNPSGALAGWLLLKKVVLDDVDGRRAGVHHRLAAPFASVITTPVSLGEDFGRRHVRYRSYKALAWLHPDRFALSDPWFELPVPAERPIVVIRAVAHEASHDRGVSGFTREDVRRLVAMSEGAGAYVVLSVESESEGVETTEFLKSRPELLRDALRAASLVVSDGASVVEEAAVLGVPAIRLSTERGERAYLHDIEDRYGLVTNFRVEQSDRFWVCFAEHLERLGELRASARQDHERLLADHHDGVDWYVRLIEAVEAAPVLPRRRIAAEVHKRGLDEGP